jgi:hypothetical protein
VFGDEVVDDEGHLPSEEAGLNENGEMENDKGEAIIVDRPENAEKV